MKSESVTNELIEWLKTNGFNVYTGIWDKHAVGNVFFEPVGGYARSNGDFVVSAKIAYISDKHDIGSRMQSISRIVNILRAFKKASICVDEIEISSVIAYEGDVAPHSKIKINIEYTEVLST